MKKQRVLIIFEKLGMGHLRMAQLFRDIIQDSMDVEIVLMTGSDILGAAFMRALVKIWNGMLRKNWIGPADFIVNTFARTVLMPISDALDLKQFCAVLDKVQPDLIISTADGYSKALGTSAV